MKVVALGLAAATLIAFGGWLAWRARSAEPAVTAPAPPGSAVRPDTPRLPTTARSKSKPIPLPDPIDPVVARDLADPDPRTRLARVSALVADGDNPAALLAASRDRDEAVSLAAMEGLGKLYAEGRVALADLVERYEDRSLSAKSRTAALEGIGLVASEDGARFLGSLGKRGDVDERRAAAILLGNQPREHAIAPLQELARDGDETVRINAKAALRALKAE